MIAVINIKLIGWISFVQLILMSVHMQCSTLRANTMCSNVSNKTYQIIMDRNNVIKIKLLQSIVDHSTVIFCTKAIMQQNVIQIANKTSIALYGLSGSHTEVHCYGNESRYRFTNVINLTLLNISFINCGGLNPAIDYNTQGTTLTRLFSAVWFYVCENVNLTNIRVLELELFLLTLLDVWRLTIALLGITIFTTNTASLMGFISSLVLVN